MMAWLFMRRKPCEVGLDGLSDKMLGYLGHNDRFKVEYLALPWDLILLFFFS